MSQRFCFGYHNIVEELGQYYGWNFHYVERGVFLSSLRVNLNKHFKVYNNRKLECIFKIIHHMKG